MGQQQILLIVLTIVVVGVASYLGIDMFQTKLRQNEADELLNRNLAIAQEAIHWRGRATIHGGGEGSFSGLATDPFSHLGVEAVTTIGSFGLTVESPSAIWITGVSSRHPEIGARVRVTGSDVDSATVRFDGTITLLPTH